MVQIMRLRTFLAPSIVLWLVDVDLTQVDLNLSTCELYLRFRVLK